MQNDRADHGFSLVEVIVAITLLMVVMIAATPLFINGLQFSADQQRQQAAVVVTQEAMEEVRARSSGLTTASPLVAGRHANDVTAQFTRLSTHSGVGETVPAADASATTGSVSALIPLTRTVQRDGTDYTVETVIGSCTLQRNAANELRCLPGGTGGSMVRAIVVTKWTAGAVCSGSAAGYCSYEALSLMNLDADLEWSDAS